MSKGTEPINPCEMSLDTSGNKTYGLRTGEYSGWSIGLTKREYFAAMAMSQAVAHWYNHPVNELCHRSLEIADEMLRQLDDADFASSLKA